MLVKITNASSDKIHVPSLGPVNIAPAAYIETSRSYSDLEGDTALKVMVETGVVTLSFTKEAGDDAGLFFGRVPTAYSDAGRPAAASVPIFAHIWNTDDDAINWSDGTDWKDAAGMTT
jgi:hypothetical protein